MDKERLNLELEIDNILSEFSKKKAASQQPARKVSDNTINMLLEDILKESGKSDGSVLQKKTAVSFDGTQKAQKPVAVQEQKTRQEKTEKGANAADGKTIAVKLSDIESGRKAKPAAEEKMPTPKAPEEKKSERAEKAEKIERIKKEEKTAEDPLKINEGLIDSIPTWEERHSKEYLEKNPGDPINKIKSMSGVKASSEFLENLKERVATLE